MAVRLLILVAERTFADALATRLEAEQAVEIVAALHGTALSPHLFRGSQADVMLLDGDLPGSAAFGPRKNLSRRGESRSVIMLSRSSDLACIARAIGERVVGWVRKDESLGHLIHVVRGVARGETLATTRRDGEVLRLLLHGPRPEQDGSSLLLAALTRRGLCVYHR